MISCNKCLNKFMEVETRKLGKCNHVFCCECLVKYLTSIDKAKVKCIILLCNSVIPDNIIRECLTDDQIKAYETLSISNTSPNFIKCLIESCPSHVDIGDGVTMFKCRYCGAQNCTKCHRIHRINDCGRNYTEDSALEARARQTLKEKRRQAFEELNKKFALIPNPNSFRCSICEDFFLPRTAVILRNCLHSFCVACLKATMLSKGLVSQRKCPYQGSYGEGRYMNCNSELGDGELYALDPEGHTDMVELEASCRFYHCVSACTGMWDVTELKGTYKCPKCSKINCLECGDIHDRMSCDEFRKTARYYQSIKNREKILNNENHVKCYVCTRQWILRGGCGAIYCDGCGGQTCAFTGMIAGKHDPDRCCCKGKPNCTKQGEYCGCQAIAPCHKRCIYGCVPEYPR